MTIECDDHGHGGRRVDGASHHNSHRIIPTSATNETPTMKIIAAVVARSPTASQSPSAANRSPTDYNNFRRTRRMTTKCSPKYHDTLFQYASLLVLLLWLYVICSFIAILDERRPTQEVGDGRGYLRHYYRSQLLNHQRLHSLPKYPVDHRRRRQTANQQLLSEEVIQQCHKALWHTVDTTTFVLPNNESFVITGDIHYQWLRDSAAQIHPLLLPNVYNGKSLVQVDANLERIVSGLILKTARYIRFDPYANAFHIHNHTNFTDFARNELGRHGYIATWNYELDSACFFMRMIYYFHINFPFHPILRNKEVRDAVEIMMDVWIAEQRHEEDVHPNGKLFDCVHCGKPYRYNPEELARDGKGTITAPSIGLTWSGFRPSDDACVYGYLIPANMFAVVVLGYIEIMAEDVWIDEPLRKKATQLRNEIDDGIKQHGIVMHETYGEMYAYEVDGLGNSLLMDDANVPSLLSIPYLGYDYDEEIFANTMRFIFSESNPWFHTGSYDGVEYSGISSPHTHFIPSSIWPMAMIMEGLISTNATHKILLVEKLLASSAGMGWMHESFNANNVTEYSRDWFCWPDSLFAELIMSLTEECPKPEKHGWYKEQEWKYEDILPKEEERRVMQQDGKTDKVGEENGNEEENDDETDNDEEENDNDDGSTDEGEDGQGSDKENVDDDDNDQKEENEANNDDEDESVDEE